MEATETVIRQQEEDLPQESKTVVVLKGQDIWKAEAAKALIEAKKIKVIDNYTYIAAGEFRDKCAARGKGLLALLNPGCQAADKLHSDLVKDRDACVDPIQEAQVVLPKTTPKVAGFSYRRIYDAKVVDRKLFLLAVIGGNIPDEAWQPNEQFLRQHAGSLKEALKWPGVKVTWKDV